MNNSCSASIQKVTCTLSILPQLMGALTDVKPRENSGSPATSKQLERNLLHGDQNRCLMWLDDTIKSWNFRATPTATWRDQSLAPGHTKQREKGGRRGGSRLESASKQRDAIIVL